MTFWRHSVHAVLAWGALSLVSAAYAADRYVLAGPAAVMAGETVEYRIEARTGDLPDAATQRVKAILPEGVSLSRNPRGFDFSGGERLLVTFAPDRAPGPVPIKFQSTADRRILGMTEVWVHRPVASFSLTPLDRPFVGRVDRPFRLQIIARDADGAVVPSFRADVNLNASAGTVFPAVARADLFVDGIAIVEVRLAATGADGRNRVEAVSRQLLAGQTSPARGSVDLVVRSEGAAR